MQLRLAKNRYRVAHLGIRTVAVCREPDLEIDGPARLSSAPLYRLEERGLAGPKAIPPILDAATHLVELLVGNHPVRCVDIFQSGLKRLHLLQMMTLRFDCAPERIEITAERVLQELAAIAFANSDDYFSWGTFERPGLALSGVTYKGKQERRVSYSSTVFDRRPNELILEVAPGELDQIRKIVEEKMGSAFPLNAPLAVNIGIGRSWGEAAH